MAALQCRPCLCSPRCPAAWTEGQAGSHGFSCAVAYKRFLTLREKCLTTDHPSRSNSGSHWGIVELFSGAAALALEWKALGVPVLGLCERITRLREWAGAHFPEAKTCQDARECSWGKIDGVRLAARVEVLTGGPACSPFTVAGRQLGSRHVDGDHLMLVVQVAAAVGARWIHLENVPDLFEDPKFRGNRLALAQDLQAAGFVALPHEVLRDSALNGITRRRRGWKLAETVAVALVLPPWTPVAAQCLDSCVVLATRTISEVLEDAEDVRQLVLRGTLELLPTPATTVDGVQKVGFFVAGGPHSEVVVGSRVRLYGAFLPTFVVWERSGKRVTLFEDSRSNPRWSDHSIQDVKSVEWFRSPVFGVQGLSPTFRTFAVPPVGNGFLILDERLGPLAVRPYSGLEMWRLHEHCPVVAGELLARGCSKLQLGEWAGSSIPRSMASRQVSLLHDRVTLLHALDALSASTGVPWVHVGAPSVSEPGQCKVLLVVVTSQPPHLLLTHEKFPLLPGVVATGKRSREALTTTATAWARALLADDRVHGLMAAEMHKHGRHTRVVTVPVADTCTLSGSATWRDVGDLHPDLADLVSVVLARLAAFGPTSHLMGDLHTTPRLAAVKRLRSRQAAESSEGVWREGQSGAIWLKPETMASAPAMSPWGESAAGLHRDQESLRDAIRAVPADHPAFVWLQETADCMTPPSLADFPSQLLESMRDYSDPALALHPLPNEPVTPHVPWLPLPSPQIQPKGFHPKSLKDLLLPEAIRLVNKWLVEVAKDLLDMCHHEGDAVRRSNRICAIGQHMFRPEARGIVWDLRRAAEGIVEPLDFHERIKTHLNLHWLQEQCNTGCLKDYPDQELLSHLFQGVQYKDDLDLQLVLFPHLISFGHGFNQFKESAIKLAERGWYSLHSTLPYAPIRVISRGSVPKADDSERPTADLSQPHKDEFDSDGRPVIPQNAAIKQACWPPETKVTVLVYMQADSTLLHLSSVSGEPLFYFSDDEKLCFNQCFLSPCQRWKAVTLLWDKGAGHAVWCCEYIMPFGVQCASNVAQRKSNMEMTIVRDYMDRAEAAANDDSVTVARWRKMRMAHFGGDPRQARAYFVDMYTDDSRAAIVGVARTLRYLVVWWEVTTSFNLMMAPTIKRQLGCIVEHIGSLSVTLGLVTVRIQKRLRAAQAIRTLLAGKLTYALFQKLVGLLGHFVFIFALKANSMAACTRALYGAVGSDGLLTHPSALVPSTPGLRASAGKWLVFVTELAGSAAGSYTLERNPIHSGSRFISWHSDAAKDDLPPAVSEAGLGGYACGYWWSWPLTDDARLLPIAVLELIAYALNFFVFGPVFQDFISTTCGLLCHCDALPAVSVSIFERSGSVLMQFVDADLRKLPIYRRLAPHTAITHEAGAGNLMADAASRGRPQVLKDFTAQMRMKLNQRALPKAALSFVHQCVAYFRSLSPVEQARDLSQPQNPDSASFPVRPPIPRLLATPPAHPVVPTRSSSPPPSVTRSHAVAEPAPAPANATGSFARPPRPVIPRLLASSVSISSQDVAVPQSSSPRHGARASVLLTRAIREQSVPPPQALVPSVQDEDSILSPLKRRRMDRLEGLAATAASHIASFLPTALDDTPQENLFGGINVEALLQTSFTDLLGTINKNTLDVDLRDWERWESITDALGEPSWRGNMAAHSGLDTPGYWKEVVLQAVVFVRVLNEMDPKSHSAPAAKPTSVTVIASVRRIHGYFGVTMAQSKLVKTFLKAASTRFIQNHGLDAFLPKRKEPFTNDELRRMVSLPQGTVLQLTATTTLTVDRHCRLWRTVLRLMHVMAQTGLRLADALKLNDDALWFDRQGVLLPTVTKELVSGFKDRKGTVVLKPGKTKSDPLGTYWAPFPIYLPVDRLAIVNAAMQCLEFEADFPNEPSLRRSTPLFQDHDDSRLARPFLENVLRAVMDLTGVDSTTHSWHSFRIYLACALKAANADDSRIKAMVRWVSDKSLHIYARDNRADYGDWLSKALLSDVDSVSTANLPEMDNDAAFALLNSIYA